MIVKAYDDYKTNFIRFVRRFVSIFGLPDFKLNALTTIMRYTVSRTRPRMRTYMGASWSWKDFPWKKSTRYHDRIRVFSFWFPCASPLLNPFPKGHKSSSTSSHSAIQKRFCCTPLQNLDLAFEEEKGVVELEAKARVVQEKNELINRYKKSLDQLVVAKNEAANKEYRLLLGKTLDAAREVGCCCRIFCVFFLMPVYAFVT